MGAKDAAGEPGSGETRDVAVECELHEAEVWAECVAACRSVKGDPLGASSVRAGSIPVPALRSVDFWLFNRVIGLGVAQPATRAQVEDIVGSYTDSEQSSFSVALSPIAEPDGELEGWLRESGFEQAGAHVKLWRPADEPAEPARTSLRIEPAPRAFAPEFERVSVESWGASVSLAPWFSAVMGRQGWYHYIAFDGDLPVATAAMRVEGPVAWFGFSATLASYRGRGAHSALVAQRIADARDLGCRVLHTETVADVPPGPAQRNLLRAGFLPIYERANFIAGERR